MSPREQPSITGLFVTPIDLLAFIDEIPVGVLVLDPERRIVAANRGLEALTGFSGPESRGVPCRDVLRSDMCFKNCPALASLKSGGPEVLEGNIINRERQKVPVRTTATPLRDEKGSLLGFLETIEDIRVPGELDESLDPGFGFGGILGQSPRMEEVLKVLPVIAQTDSSVLITGETGTGKDFVAEAIHNASGRAKGPYVKVNCGALPETLLESELFGHKKGAFTGAVQDKPGRFRLAHNGTLYLTEIGDLSLPIQVKLLTFLDDRVVYPLGTTKGFRADVRMIAATHRDLERMVQDGKFRADLLFRLNVVRLHLPPLRERGDDVIILMEHFLSHFSMQFGKQGVGFSPRARKILMDYRYPGNVRELRNIVEYAVNICPDREIGVAHLPVYIAKPEIGVGVPGAAMDAEAAPAGVEAPEDEPVRWSEVEKRLIIDALVKAGGRRGRAAQILGWGRSTLWRKMKKYGIED